MNPAAEPPASGPRKFPRRPSVLERFLIFFSNNGFYHKLFPRPDLDFTIRPYVSGDCAQVVNIYDLNAPNHFPPEDRMSFVRYLEGNPSSYFVVETKDGKIAACGGVSSAGTVHCLCYGMVLPAYQSRGLGTTLTLARLAFAARSKGVHLCYIFSLPKSIGFYRRMGFEVCVQGWTGSDGKEYPIGLLTFEESTMRSVSKTLAKRGHLIDPALPVDRFEWWFDLMREHEIASGAQEPKRPGEENSDKAGLPGTLLIWALILAILLLLYHTSPPFAG